MNCAFFSIFYHTWKIMTKKFISDFRWRRLQVRKKMKNYFHFFFETGPVSWNYFTFFSQFHFFSCFFLPKKTSFWPVFVKKWGFRKTDLNFKSFSETSFFLQKKAKNSCCYAKKSMKKSETGKKKWSSFMKLDQFQKKSENNFYFFFRTCNRLHLKSGIIF